MGSGIKKRIEAVDSCNGIDAMPLSTIFVMSIKWEVVRLQDF